MYVGFIQLSIYVCIYDTLNVVGILGVCYNKENKLSLGSYLARLLVHM